jgi:hypothetical protein
VTDFSIESGNELLEGTDPHLMTLGAQLDLDRFHKDGDKYVNDVQSDIVTGVNELKQFSKQKNSAATLKVIKSKVRNDFLGGMNSTGSIAQAFAWYYRFNRNPQVLDMLMEGIDSLTPQDVDAYANKYFTDKNQVVTTLWHDQASAQGVE